MAHGPFKLITYLAPAAECRVNTSCAQVRTSNTCSCSNVSKLPNWTIWPTCCSFQEIRCIACRTYTLRRPSTSYASLMAFKANLFSCCRRKIRWWATCFALTLVKNVARYTTHAISGAPNAHCALRIAFTAIISRIVSEETFVRATIHTVGLVQPRPSLASCAVPSRSRTCRAVSTAPHT